MKVGCSIYRTASFMGKRWSMQIILEIYKKGPVRFSALKKRLPFITSKLLSMRLRELESEGLVSLKKDISRMPISCEYSLTASGSEFVSVLKEIKRWTLKWKKEDCFCQSADCRACGL